MKRQRTNPMGWARWTSLLLAAILAITGIASSNAAPPPVDAVIAGVTELPSEAFSAPIDLGGFLSEKGNPKLDSALNSLLSASKTSAQAAIDRAEAWSLRLSGDRVHVQIAIDPSALTRVRDAVAQAGGEITGVGNEDTLLQGWLPISALETIAGHDDVWIVRRPAEALLAEQPLAGASTTEGLAVINGPAWHASGYTGSGVKVGIIDGGFQGYAALRGTDLPASVTVKNFVDGQNDSQVDGTTPHGTACAEVIHDIAPNATLYLAKISTNIDLQEAVTWLKDTHHVNVISVSMSWYNLTPGDGTGQFANLVAGARSAGILWATAASNDRENHWGGLYTDADGDNSHEFNGVEVNCFGPGDTTCYNINPGYSFRAFLRWNDWTNVNQDYALLLLRWNGTGWDVIGSSNNPQNGGGGQTPTEYAVGTTSGSSTPYAVAIVRINSTQRVNLELFVPKWSRMRKILYARSLANLADAPDAITVAALDVNSPYPQESYSSEGPANGPGGAEAGGAIKPDIAAFANVSTQSYGSGTNRFNGTSSATPHVAGAAALVKSAYPGYTPAQIQSFLQGRAIDMGTAGKDTRFGYGRLHLGAPPSPSEMQYVYLPIILNKYPPAPELPGTLYPTADATVLQGAASTNFGTTTDMWVGYDHCEPLKIGHSLAKFDVSAIPAGTSITNATLRLYLTNSCDIGERTHTVQVYRTSGNWAESTVTWNSKPGYAEAYGSRAIRSRTWGWYTFDVTGLVQGWVNGSLANQGLTLRGPESSGDSSARLGFLTREASGTTYDPRIVITYAGGASTDAPAEDQAICTTQSGLTVQDLASAAPSAEKKDTFTFAQDVLCP